MSRRKRIPEGHFSATIEKCSHEGRGIAHIEGKKVFIDGALPGEAVDFEYTYVKSKMAQGRALTIHQASPDRVTPPCEAYSVCGGCALQHLKYDEQLKLKQQTVLEHYKTFAHLEPDNLLPVLTSKTEGYRKKARVGVRFVPKKGGALVGFREKFSNRIAVMDACSVLDKRVGQKIGALKEIIGQLSIAAQIPQIEVSIGSDEVALVFRILEPFQGEDEAKLIAFSQAHNFSLYTQSGGYDSVKKIYPENSDFLLKYHLPKQNLTLFFHPLDFTQVNAQINEQMIDAAIDQLDLQPSDRVLDLFCGIGNFTLPLAQKVKDVVGVEGSFEAIERAQFNAAHNGIQNVRFHVQNLFAPPFDGGWESKKYDKILIDPPRAGALEALPWIAESGANTLVYVSCNSATLARDVGILVHDYGFKLEALRLMDMFAHTAHVECMATLRKDK